MTPLEEAIRAARAAAAGLRARRKQMAADFARAVADLLRQEQGKAAQQ